MNREQAELIRRRGEAFEIRVMNRVKRGAVFAQRCAGSRGAADVMALMPSGMTRLIQCKANGYIEPAERVRLKRLHARLPRGSVLEIYWMKSPRTMGRRIVTRPETIDEFASC